MSENFKPRKSPIGLMEPTKFHMHWRVQSDSSALTVLSVSPRCGSRRECCTPGSDSRWQNPCRVHRECCRSRRGRRAGGPDNGRPSSAAPPPSRGSSPRGQGARGGGRVQTATGLCGGRNLCFIKGATGIIEREMTALGRECDNVMQWVHARIRLRLTLRLSIERRPGFQRGIMAGKSVIN